MYSILDLILAAIMIFIVFRSWKRGFLSSILNIISIIISTVASFLFYSPLAEFIKTKFILSPVVKATRNELSSLADNGDVHSLFSEMPEALRSFLSMLGFDPDAVYSDFASSGLEASSFADDLAQRIGSSVSSLIASALSFIILFIACMLILSVIRSILCSLLRSRVLSFANKFLGLVTGLLSAMIFGWIISNAIVLMSGGLVLFFPNAFSSEALDSSIIISFFSALDPFNI